jgi:hypothetical protein
MTEDPDHHEIIEHLTKTMELAGDRALYELVLAIARHVGIRTVQGTTLDDFYCQRVDAIAEELVAAYADENPSKASKVKELWQKLDRGEL